MSSVRNDSGNTLTLPKPISSARIPLIPCSYRVASQLRPFNWYSLSVAISIFGCWIVSSPVRDVGFWKFSSSESTASVLATAR